MGTHESLFSGDKIVLFLSVGTLLFGVQRSEADVR